MAFSGSQKTGLQLSGTPGIIHSFSAKAGETPVTGVLILFTDVALAVPALVNDEGAFGLGYFGEEAFGVGELYPSFVNAPILDSIALDQPELTSIALVTIT